MKILIAAVFSVACIWLHSPDTPKHLNNLEAKAVTQTAGQRHSATLTAKYSLKASQTVQPKKMVAAAKPKPRKVTPTYPTNCATYEPLVAQYNWNVRVAMAIMRAESGCNPYAISNAALNYDGISDFGLFQIHGQDVLEPAQNIAIAYQKYQRQGWYAWSTYNSGAVWSYYE